LKATLYFDGSNDPKMVRRASFGYVLEIEGRPEIMGQGLVKEDLPQTNNSAEYTGLLSGILRAKQEGVTDLHIIGDSQLVIYQVTGKYKCKLPHLKNLLTAVHMNLRYFNSWQAEWKRRAHNKADEHSRVTE